MSTPTTTSPDPALLARLRPPPIPFRRRALRAAFRAWPAFVWCCALGTAIWLYMGLAVSAHGVAQGALLEVHASAAVAARIATVRVTVGDQVTAGDVVATLDARDLDARLAVARTKLERSRTRISAMREAFANDARDRHAQAAARRSSYESEGRRIRAAMARLAADDAADRAELEALTPQIDRLRPLANQNLVTIDRLEALIQSRAVLQTRIASHTDGVRSAREELAAWRDLAPEALVELDATSQLMPYELELAADEARIAQLAIERTGYEIHAPASGVVRFIAARPGEWREAGDDIAVIVVPVPERVTAYVPGAHMRTVRAGTVATLLPRDRRGRQVEGHVLDVGPGVEAVPPALRAIPTIPQWGRRVSISVADADAPLPGEAFLVRFE